MSPIDQLINAIGKLPGLGPRSAQRITLKLLREPEKLLTPLLQSLQEVQQSVVSCEVCGNLDVTSPCPICCDERRDAGTICIVEDVADLWAIERGGMFRGRYHVLGGTLSAIDGRGPDALGIPKLLKRISQGEIREIILATNNTLEGQTTAHYLQEALEPFHLTLTRLAQGIPVGGELDYLDEGTLGAALMSRVKMS
jgi:recombination protein RecR